MLLAEVLEHLRPAPGMIFLDATVGGGGHAAAIARRIQPGGKLIGVDRDAEALSAAAHHLEGFGSMVKLVQSRFDRLDEVLAEAGVRELDGVLVDAGVSSRQLDTAERGFSFSRPGPLDMRMDQSSGMTAAEWLERASVEEMTRSFYQYGEERWSRRIADRIAEARRRSPLTTTDRLADVIAGAVPRSAWPRGINPATRVFQAIRIVLNEELAQLGKVIELGVGSLRTTGRMAVISFHSLEDRIVKQSFARLAGACTCPPGMPVCGCGAVALVKLITRKPVIASEDEVRTNPRARSAKLRVVERM